MKIKKKIFIAIQGFAFSTYFMMTEVFAKPGIDEAGMKNEVQEWTTPLTNIALWVIPIVGGLAALYHGISWLTKEEDEKEQKPIKKILKKILFATIILELIPTIMKLLGL